ncbi:MAG: hypothetical protein AB7O68_24490 [Pirellulales bacterium]
MLVRISRITAGCLCLGLVWLAPPAQRVLAEEWEENTPYYEDDAWYDISEWFDGNDYNPTDEVFGRWDDETYDSDVADYDSDNDFDYGYYDGTLNNDRWFYDYWNPGYRYYGGDGDTYEYAYEYHDYDGDGLYDAYTRYYDWDDDGWFEDIRTVNYSTGSARRTSQAGDANQDTDTASASSGDTAAAGDTASSKKHATSKPHDVSGKITAVKQVKVRGVPHTVARIQQDDGKTIAVDLGPAEGVKSLKLDSGTQVKARGALTKAGEKPVLLARSLTVDGNAHQLDRQAREFQGTIVDTRKSKVHGREVTLLVLKTDAGKQRLVDLGPSSRLQQLKLQKDTKVTVRGVPLKDKDRPVVMAQSIEADGSSVQIDRRPEKEKKVS